MEHIGISAMGWSGTTVSGAGSSLLTSAGGIMWEVGVPLVLLWITWHAGRSMFFWMVALSLKGLGSSLLYMLAGITWRAGDSADLIRAGASPSVLTIVTVVLSFLLLPVASLVGPLLGIGRGRTSYRTTMLSLFTPLAACILMFCAYIVVARPPDLPFWLALAAGAAVLTAALVTWIHLSAPWFNKESVRNHAVTISPLRAMLGLTRGLAVALAIYTLFPE